MEQILLKKNAYSKFKQKTKIYVYFKSKYYWEQINKMFLFNPEFDFDKNIEIIKSKFEGKEGFLQYFTNNDKYEKNINLVSQNEFKQLSLF